MFGRIGTDEQQKVFATFGKVYPTANPALDFVNNVSNTATSGAAMVRTACAEYKTLVDYGSDNDLTLDLKKVAAMITAKFPTRIFYLSQGGYDHHAAQAEAHLLLLIYLSDALKGFLDDMKRIGRADDVAVMIFTELGRRVQENASQGTDHGTARTPRRSSRGTSPHWACSPDRHLPLTCCKRQRRILTPRERFRQTRGNDRTELFSGYSI